MSETPFVVRPAGEDDVPGMLRLWRQMMDFHADADPRFRPTAAPEGEQAWERFVREHAWTDEDWRVVVAEKGGRIIGHCVGVLRDRYPVFEPARYGVVMDMVVDRDVRRSGAGQALFAELKMWFRECGASYVELQVAHRNATSQAFWRAMGCTDYMDTLWYDLGAQ